MIKGVKPKTKSMLAFDVVGADDDTPPTEITPENLRPHPPVRVAVKSAEREAEIGAAPENAPPTILPKTIAKPSTGPTPDRLALLVSDSESEDDEHHSSTVVLASADTTGGGAHGGVDMSFLNNAGSIEDTGSSGGFDLSAMLSSSEEDSSDDSD